jgi:hypothetical protein
MSEACMTSTVTLEMGFTRADLIRCIGEAFGENAAFAGDAVVVTLSGGSVCIRFSGDRVRKIALVRLPVLDVEISFDKVGEAAARAFRQRFDLYTLRGGG